MQLFDKFFESVVNLKNSIDDIRRMRLNDLESIDFEILEKVFKKINIMYSNCKLVGNSKVMAHLAPNLVPPIDRFYTLRYIKNSKNIKNGIDLEFNLFRDLMENFFIKVASDHKINELSNKWVNNQKKYPWDTSLPKVIDNLIIGAVKSNR